MSYFNPYQSFSKAIEKEMKKEVPEVHFDLYDLAEEGSHKREARISFNLQLNSRDPHNMAHEVFNFWHKLRNHLKLEIEKPYGNTND